MDVNCGVSCVRHVETVQNQFTAEAITVILRVIQKTYINSWVKGSTVDSFMFETYMIAIVVVLTATVNDIFMGYLQHNINRE
jgi:hypothetical protein